ncbi:MAG: flagellar basal body-associated FliL family protein [Bdellovibrionota bacterium]
MAEQKTEKKEEKKFNVALIGKIGFIVFNFAILGLGSYWTYMGTLGWKKPTITEASVREMLRKPASEAAKADPNAPDANAEPDPFVYTMDKFVVNLGGEPKRTIQLEVNLEMLGEDGFEEIMESDNRAKARDRIVRLLNGHSFQELETIQGKLFLKDKIAFEINSLLNQGIVKDVYFSDFVVQ